MRIKMSRYIIVKYASEYIDNKMIPSAEENCSHTYTGKQLGISAFYDSREEAKRDLERLQEVNPSVDYGIFEI
jgi:hypothetical protein